MLQVFDEETKLHLNLQNDPDDYEAQSKKPHLPFLSLFFEGKLSEEMVKQQFETLLMAGFES